MKAIIAITAIMLVFAIAPPAYLSIVGDTIPDSTENVDVRPGSARDLENRIKTAYGIDGRPVYQSEYAKGRHEVWGTASLEKGVDTIDLNTSTGDGLQDVSFMADSTYAGSAWIPGQNGNTYVIIPLSGRRFIVVSSDTTDTARVRFRLEGH